VAAADAGISHRKTGFAKAFVFRGEAVNLSLEPPFQAVVTAKNEQFRRTKRASCIFFTIAERNTTVIFRTIRSGDQRQKNNAPLAG